MLDLAGVVAQVEAMAAERLAAGPALRARAEAARRALEACGGGDALAALRRRAEAAKLPWLAAIPLETPLATFPPPPRPADYAVAAADGSQIFPDRHEVALCYLINVGTVLIRYGSRPGVEMGSRPELFFREEDLYEEDAAGRRRAVEEESVSARRAQLELEALAALVDAAAGAGVPAVAFVDGTLILWHLFGRPEAVRRRGVAALEALLDRARERGVPVAGYLSAPRAAEVANLARLAACPVPDPDCGGCRYRKAGDPPCEAAAGVDDALLLAPLLGGGAAGRGQAGPEGGRRSALFESRSEILKYYRDDHRVCFFHVDAGAEAARVEVPRWVARDPDLVKLVHAAAVDQARKGQGYPVALDEAHKQAVVSGADRRAFFDLVARALAGRGVAAAISRKSFSKRGGVL